MCLCINYYSFQGDLILTESPTVWVDGHHPFNQKQIVEIEGKTQNLSAYDKKAFFDMANVFPELR